MTQYVALTYTADVDWSAPEQAEDMVEYKRSGGRARGADQGGDVLYPTSTATTVRVTGARGRRRGRHRRPVRGDQGGADRVLPDRGGRPGRGDRDRRRPPGRLGRRRRVRPADPRSGPTAAESDVQDRLAEVDPGRGCPDAGHPRPVPRRLVAGRGGRAGGGRSPPCGTGRPRAARPSAGLADRHRPAQGHRHPAPGTGPRGQGAGGSRADGADPARRPARQRVLDDDLLRLIFTCCHPGLAPEARLALALRTLCQLSVAAGRRGAADQRGGHGEAADPDPAEDRRGRDPATGCPADAELPERLGAVCGVVHALYTSGHAPVGRRVGVWTSTSARGTPAGPAAAPAAAGRGDDRRPCWR